MQHVTPGRLADLALGNAAAGDDAEALRHLAECAPCREEFTRLHRVVVAARDVEQLDLPLAPPARVWQEIVRELALPLEDVRPAAAPRDTAPTRPRARRRVALASFATAARRFARRARALAAAARLTRRRRPRDGRPSP
ncbi:hypothetical protein [Streptomyces sp. t39]|uniref:hypothetical protein n=1 Tax=Streptomyces sp. t39 TaxID=1828156 RepID=UPI0011CD8B7D|nr:hypothetical protein [Streptomyces sp. t39]